MSSDAKLPPNHNTNIICPNCNNYVISTDGSDKDDSLPDATPVTKRKHNGVDHGASLSSKQSSSMKKIRHSESPATTQFVRPWDSIPNYKLSSMGSNLGWIRGKRVGGRHCTSGRGLRHYYSR